MSPQVTEAAIKECLAEISSSAIAKGAVTCAIKIALDPPSHRRFDALNLLRQPVVERGLEAMYKADLEALLPDTFQSCLLLDTAENLFELHGAGGKAGVERCKLAEAIVRRGYVAFVTEAEAEIDNHLRLGLLRSVATVNRAKVRG